MERLTERTPDGILVKEDYGEEVLKTLYQCYGAEPMPHYANCDEGYCAMEKLAEYEDLEEQGRSMKLPCAVGDAAYVLAECENIPAQLDGTLYGADGGPGTATGYYCPYEDNCPFDDEDFEDCKKCKNKTAVFEDTVGDITIGEDGVWVNTVNCSVCGQIGSDIFLTRQEAEDKLAEMEGKKLRWNLTDIINY